MSEFGVEMVKDSTKKIQMIMKMDVFNEIEIRTLEAIFQKMLDLTKKVIAAGPRNERLYQTLQVVGAKAIKCGDALHCCVDTVTGALSVILADATHGQNAVAIEDLTGSEGLLNPKTGQVCNVLNDCLEEGGS